MSRVTGLSPDGGSVLLTIISPKTGFDLWLASNKPPFEARPIVAIQGADTSASVSPDGRWIAYSSEESGIDEIYVRPFPAVEQGRWQVSTTGGLSPRFSRDSRELYYFTTRSAGTSTTLTLMAVKIQAGSAFGASSPEVVAPLPFGVRGYDVAADGRFIISAPVAVNGASGGVLRQSIVVVENWPSLLRSGLAATSPQ
jgi:hypothetical protein